MQANVTVDLKDWERAIAIIQSRVNKTLPEVLNRSAASIAIKAYKNTKFVKDQFLIDLYKVQTGTSVSYYKRDSKKSGKKKGDVRKGKSIYQLSHRAYGTMVERFGLEERGEALREKVEKLVKLSIISTEFLRAGWVRVMQGMAKWTKSGKVTGKKRADKKHPLGTWKEAIEHPQMKPFAEIWNRTPINNPTAVQVVEPALDKAIITEISQLKRQAENMLRDEIRKAGG